MLWGKNSVRHVKIRKKKKLWLTAWKPVAGLPMVP